MTEFPPNVRTRVVVLLAVLASALQLSCGLATVSGGTSGTGYSQGPIDGFGSILVGDVWWDIEDAEIVFDGDVVAEDVLDLRQVVSVEGEIAADGVSGTATRVLFDDAVEGPIKDDPVVIDPLVRELSVLGWTVVIHAEDTIFAGDPSGTLFSTLAKDDVIEVSGLVDRPAQRIIATWVDLVEPFQVGVSRAELRGVVQGLEVEEEEGEVDGEFEIGPVTVYFDEDTVLEGFPFGALVEGQLVEVNGVLDGIEEIDADFIEFETEGLPIQDADDVEIFGIVSGFTDVDTPFSVSGTTVDASNAAIEGSLADGVLVEVEGALVSGVLLAEEVEVEDDDDDDDDDD